MVEPISILNGQAKLYPPTESYKQWRIRYTDPLTKQRKATSGGASEVTATQKAWELLGYEANQPKQTIETTIPTFRELCEKWLEDSSDQWAEHTLVSYKRTVNNYVYPFIADKQITAIALDDIRKIDTSHASRGTCVTIQRCIRNTFKLAENWTHRSPDDYADAVIIQGTKASTRKNEVNTPDIPTSTLVASVINTAFSTYQLSPLDDPTTVHVDPLTGVKTRTKGRIAWAQGIGMTTPMDDIFLNGLKTEQFSGRDKNSRHISHQGTKQKDVLRIARQWRNVGLAAALQAGAALNTGEVLALRVRHVLTVEQTIEAFLRGKKPAEHSYRGALIVAEQDNRVFPHNIIVKPTEGAMNRITHIPYYLPNWNGEAAHQHRYLLAQVVSRFADTRQSLWTSTDVEAITLWQHGFIPLGWLLWNRLEELWNHPAINYDDYQTNLQMKLTAYQNMLLFPTVNQNKPTKFVNFSDDYPYDKTITPETGSYQQTDYYGMNWLNHLFDHASEVLNEYPPSRVNYKQRKGWAPIDLRTYAVNWRIQAGVPLPTIATETGYVDSKGVIKRFWPVINDLGAQPTTGFDY